MPGQTRSHLLGRSLTGEPMSLQSREDMRLDLQPGMPGDAPQRGHKRGVAHIHHGMAALAIRVEITQTHRNHGHAGIERGLNQVAMKHQQPITLAGGALRKDSRAIALRHAGTQGLNHAMHGMPTAPLHKHRTGTGHERAHQRPAGNLGLGHEGCRCDRIDHEDIEPGDVVGQQQTALSLSLQAAQRRQRLRTRCHLLPHLHATGPQQCARPDCDQRLAAGHADPRKDAKHRGQSEQQQGQYDWQSPASPQGAHS